MTHLRKTIAAGIAVAREGRGLTQTELAQLTGMMPSAIAHFEAGRRLPSCENMLKLADALELSIDDLFGRTKNRSSWVESPFASRIAKMLRKMKQRDQQTLADLATMIVGNYGKKMVGCGSDE